MLLEALPNDVISCNAYIKIFLCQVRFSTNQDLPTENRHNNYNCKATYKICIGKRVYCVLVDVCVSRNKNKFTEVFQHSHHRIYFA